MAGGTANSAPAPRVAYNSVSPQSYSVPSGLRGLGSGSYLLGRCAHRGFACTQLHFAPHRVLDLLEHVLEKPGIGIQFSPTVSQGPQAFVNWPAKNLLGNGALGHVRRLLPVPLLPTRLWKHS
jgi:hypothetical protein